MGIFDDTKGVADAHFAAVGKVASAWSLFEALLDITIWRFANIDPKILACVTSQVVGSGRKMDAVIALVRLQGGDRAVAPFNKFNEATQKLAERRNRIVHDPWMQKAGLTARIEFTARKKLVLETVAVPTTDVIKLADEIANHIEKFEILTAPFLPPLVAFE